jgi:hypothetical protein
MQMSANGSDDGRPATASWNALSTSSRLSASTIVPPWTCGSNPGWLVNTGSRSSARLIFTVPLRVCQARISATKSGGSAPGSSSRRNEICGWAVVTTVPAATSSPLARVTPVTRPPLTRILATSAPVRISAPDERAAAASAAVTPPMPPRGKPQAPACPSSPPIWWWSMT